MNPELQRNLWTDATPRRLYWTVATTLIVFAVVWLVDRGRHPGVSMTAGAALFFGSGLVWAPRAARRSVTAEVAGGTWDFQRLSALTPWALTWGKLAGATVRPWVLAAGGLAIALLQLASTTTMRRAGFWLFVGLGLAVTLQACGLATGLLDVRRGRASGRALSGRAPGLAILSLAVLTFAALFWARVRIGHSLHGTFGEATPLDGPVLWFGHASPPVAFAAATLVVCAVWAVIWAWRLMRLELQFINTPWAWCLFCLTAVIYAAGFDVSVAADPGAVRLLSAALTAAALAYVGAFAEPADRVRARQFAQASAAGHWMRAAARLPLVILPSLLAILTALVVAALHARDGDPAAALLVLALLAFFLRDLGLIAWRRFSPRAQPGDLSVAAMLGAAYVLGGLCGRLFGGLAGQAAFVPSAALPGLSAGLGLAEAAAVWAMAVVRIRQPLRRALPRVWRPAPPATPPSPPPTA